MASPSAPPSRREVFTRPDASPASDDCTPDTAAIVTGTNAAPMPPAVTMPAASTSLAKLPPAEMRENSSMPTACPNMPVMSSGLAPMRPTRRDGGGDGDRERHRDERHTGLQRRVAEHLLQVERDEVPHGEHRGTEQEH